MLLYLIKMDSPTTKEYLSFILLILFLTSSVAISPFDSLSCLWVLYVLCPPFTSPGLSPLLPNIFSRFKPTMNISIFSGNCAPRDFSITFNLLPPSKQKETFSSYLVNFASVVEFGKFHLIYNGLHAYCM